MSYKGKNAIIKSDHPDQKSGNSGKIKELPDFLIKTGAEPGQFISLDSILQELSKEKKMLFYKPLPGIDYRAPKLTRGQQWVITYYVKNPATGKMRRCRCKLNHIKPLKERARVARELMAGIAERLALGWNPICEEAAPRSAAPAFQAYDAFIAVKTKEAEAQSVASYRSYIKIFKEWLQKHGFDERRPISCVTRETALEFMDHLDGLKTISARTWNNYLSFLQSLHSWLMEKGYLPANPFDGIRRKPKRLTAKTRRTFTEDELARLFAWLRDHNPEYLAVCLLCYGCFIRPKEIARLKCRDIDLGSQTVHVRGEIAKNDRESYRTIPDEMMPAFRRLDLSRPDWALFGRNYGVSDDFRPGREHADQRKFAGYWSGTVRDALGFPNALQLYSLKDTGITRMATSGVAINLVQQQADHSNVAITSVYLGKAPEACERIRKVKILP